MILSNKQLYTSLISISWHEHVYGWDQAILCGGQCGRIWICGQPHTINFGLSQPLFLGPAILEPDLDLGFSKTESTREFGAFRDGQILLLLELLLQ